MNDIWSKQIQGPKTLYYSRKLRFDNLFASQYKALFGLEEDRELKILEIGCGPGALAGALRRWYPKAQITALDRDSDFIAFARQREPGICFLEGDATALPFEDESFDVCVSNTVSEHIEPGAFFGEQRRVLKPGGLCLLLSARRGITVTAPVLEPSQEEQAFWQRMEQTDDSFERYTVGKYALNEAQLPAALEQHGFHSVETGFAVIDLCPDAPKFSPALARDIIDAERYMELENLDSLAYSLGEQLGEGELEKMRRLVNRRFDARLAQYERGEKQWDCAVSLTMVLRGVK